MRSYTIIMVEPQGPSDNNSNANGVVAARFNLDVDRISSILIYYSKLPLKG